MGVSTHTLADYPSSVAPARLFHAFCYDGHNILPKVVPEFVKSVDVIQGELGSVGSIRQVNFPEGNPFKYAKNRIDEIDASKFYTTMYEVKFEPTGYGCHYTMVVHHKGDYVIKEEDIAIGKQNSKKMFNAVEQYLTANPELYA
ncbi:hypothetical protein RND81_05G211000 [Saponaria officinalis]|uniref:Bet v I/Major latex protein domain-containing protein n=1 Tax=Saponaria officinalis TaxID=3572 RepID=A0AAW1L031_SAPOF